MKGNTEELRTNRKVQSSATRMATKQLVTCIGHGINKSGIYEVY